MSVNLTIRQKGLNKKVLPLSVILGDKLRYGRYTGGWKLEEGKLADNEFIAFLPDAVARGFSVTWNAQEKQQIVFRLLSPTGREEIREFYKTVQRIMQYWNADLFIEDERVDPNQWALGLDEFIDFNTFALRSFCRQLLEREDKQLTLLSAFWPLTLGKEDAVRFADNPDSFESWLHEKQSIDAYYASPLFYQIDGGIVGRYTVSDGIRIIFPSTPEVPFGAVDPNTGKQLKCSCFQVVILSVDSKKPVGMMDFDSFIHRLPSQNVSKYDQKSILIEPLSLLELQTILG